MLKVGKFGVRLPFFVSFTIFELLKIFRAAGKIDPSLRAWQVSVFLAICFFSHLSQVGRIQFSLI